MRLLLSIPLAILATSAVADLDVVFREGAPKDQFTFTASDNCLSGPVEIVLDLSGSDAGLIFDVSSEGLGVEVFQPLELVDGRTLVAETSEVADGDTQLMLMLESLPAGQPVSFTIDLDDTIGAREIIVSDNEIAGASVSVKSADMIAKASFLDGPRLTVPLPDCLS